MSQDVSCLSLRVKRRRDAEAAPELILETTSSRSAGSVPELAASLRQSLAVSHSHQGASSAAAEAPAEKRCRFVLVSAADSEAAPTAASGAAGQEQGLAGPVLELWHTSAAAERSSAAAQHAASGNRRPKAEPDAQELRAGVYDAMVQQYLQEQQQQQHVPTSTQQQCVRHRPSKRAHRTNSRPQSAPSCQQQAQEQQQQHQQGPQLPAYMTAGMLKQYGLWQGLQAQQQQQLQCTVSQPDAAAAGAAAASTYDSQDMDYAYDMYVAAADPEDDDGAGGFTSCAGMDASNCQQEGADMRPGTPNAAADLPVIQVWEDELQQLHESWALGQDAAGAGDADSEDSNAEDFYGNEYPEEEDGSYQDSMDSLDTEDEGQEGRAVSTAVSSRRQGLLGSSSSIGFYQPGDGGAAAGSSSRKAAGKRVHAQDRSGAVVEGGYGSDGSFDVEDYVSSGDEQGEGRQEEAGPAWLHKHCTAYGTDAGGQAWRSVLAQQFAP